MQDVLSITSFYKGQQNLVSFGPKKRRFPETVVTSEYFPRQTIHHTIPTMVPSYQTVPLANVPTKANGPKEERASNTPVPRRKQVAGRRNDGRYGLGRRGLLVRFQHPPIPRG